SPACILCGSFGCTEKKHSFIEHDVKPVEHMIICGFGIEITVLKRCGVGNGQNTFISGKAIERTLNAYLFNIQQGIDPSDDYPVISGSDDRKFRQGILGE